MENTKNVLTVGSVRFLFLLMNDYITEPDTGCSKMSHKQNWWGMPSELKGLYYRVIAMKSVNIVPSWDIEGYNLASIRRYPNEGQY